MKKISLILLIGAILSLSAQEVRVVFSRTTPPFVFKDDTGITVDIVKEALAYKKHTVRPLFVDIAKGVEMFKDGLADANSMVQEDMDMKAYYSDVFMQYQNAIYALASSKIELRKLEDIKNYYSIAFQNAHQYLGKEFGEAAKNAGDRYRELADQKQQVHMFFEGRTDIIILEDNIFTFYRDMLIDEDKIAPDIKVKRFDFFSPTKYQVSFRDRKLRDDFNEGLRAIRANGTYDAIYEKYGKKYFEIKR